MLFRYTLQLDHQYLSDDKIVHLNFVYYMVIADTFTFHSHDRAIVISSMRSQMRTVGFFSIQTKRTRPTRKNAIGRIKKYIRLLYNARVLLAIEVWRRTR